MELKDIKLVKGMTKYEVNELTKDYILLEDEVYLGNAYKHNWRCLCGNLIRGRIWANISCRDNGNICALCRGYSRSGKNLPYELSFAYYIEKELGFKLEEIWDFDKNILNPYHITKSCRYKVYIKCQEKDYHGSYEISCSNFYNGKRCSYCASHKTHSLDSFGQYLKENNLLHLWSDKNKIDPFSIKMRSSCKKVWMLCDKHDYHNDYGGYETTCYKFITGTRCSYCSSHGTIPLVHPLDSFGYHNFDKVMSWHPDNDISPFRVSKSSGKKYKFICYECGHVWEVAPHSISNGTWCPNCKSSKGERKIKDYLISKCISFEREKIFDDLIWNLNYRRLRYDFYLPDYKICIEYDGQQHFKPVDFAGKGRGWAKNRFEYTKVNDNMKNEYCKKKNIKLIRIPYWEFDNIEYILEKELNTYSKIS